MWHNIIKVTDASSLKNFLFLAENICCFSNRWLILNLLANMQNFVWIQYQVLISGWVIFQTMPFSVEILETAAHPTLMINVFVDSITALLWESVCVCTSVDLEGEVSKSTASYAKSLTRHSKWAVISLPHKYTFACLLHPCRFGCYLWKASSCWSGFHTFSAITNWHDYANILSYGND